MWIDFLYGMDLEEGDVVKARPYMNRRIFEVVLVEFLPEKNCWKAETVGLPKDREQFLIDEQMVVRVWRE